MIHEAAVTTTNGISLEQLTLITTIFLMLITGYYAIITHRILGYQKKITELEYRPFIKMDEMVANRYLNKVGSEINGIQWGVKLVNVSRVLVKFEMNKMDGSINNIINENPEFVDKIGYLYPGQSYYFYYPVIKVPENLGTQFEGDFSYELTYYASEKKKYKSIRNYLVTFNKINKVDVLFVYRSKNEQELEL